MLEATKFTETNPNFPFFAFKPRQVLLAEHSRKMTATPTKKKQDKIQTPITPGKKAILHHCMLRYLEKNGFSRTLKRFLSEAQIEEDDWKASSLDLEDMYIKYMEASPYSDTNLSTFKEQELGADETTKLKKKKRSDGSDTNTIVDEPKASDEKLPKSVENSGEVTADIMVTESEAKSEGKKKSKGSLDTPSQTEQVKLDVSKKPLDDAVHEFKVDDSSKKPKDKKKKKKRRTLDAEPVGSTVEGENLEPLPDVNEDNSKEFAALVCNTGTGAQPEVKHKDKKKKNKSSTRSPVEDAEQGHLATKQEKKSSKKRKRLASEENDYTEMDAIEESKLRKAEGLEEETNNDGLLGNGHISKESQGESAQDDHHEKLEMNGGQNFGSQRTLKRQRNSSAEPKTVNAFQRVKIDEVVFADEKLQDNSYWAKDGAEVGYGAKAQEVLGQVKGRDFRHEKTKKKRGSYRGGLIDLQSHSIKFNYSDED